MRNHQGKENDKKKNICMIQAKNYEELPQKHTAIDKTML